LKYYIALVRPTARSFKLRKAALKRSIKKLSHLMHLSTTVAVVVLLVAMQAIVIVLLQYRLLLDLEPIRL
jgi:hypothetical protein